MVVHLYVEDADAWFARASEAGAKTVMPIMDTFWGDRYGAVDDPFGRGPEPAAHAQDRARDRAGVGTRVAASYLTLGATPGVPPAVPPGMGFFSSARCP